MLDPIQLEIKDITGEPINNQFWQVDHPNEWLALLLPGLRYTSDMPLMYFPRQMLLKRNVSILNLNPGTRSEDFQTASRDVQLSRLQHTVISGVEAGLRMGDFRNLLLVGKSIGTLAIAQAFPEIIKLPPPTLIWLTPLLREEVIFKVAMTTEGPQAFICGGADPTFDNGRLKKIISEKPLASAFVAPGANHSLESEGDDQVTFRGFSEAMLFLANFLDQNL